MQSHTEIARWHVDNNPHRIAISADGRQVAIAYWDERKYVDLFDVASPSKSTRLTARQCNAICYSDDNRRIAVGDMDDLLIYDLDDASLIHRLVGHTWSLNDAAFSADGRTIATVSDDRRLKLWDTTSGHEIGSAQAHLRYAYSVTFSSDGRLLATAGEDGMVRIWHTATLQPMLDIETGGPVFQTQFAGDDQCLVVQLRSADKTLVYDVRPHPRSQESMPISTSNANLIGFDHVFDGNSFIPTEISGDGLVVIGDLRSGRDTQAVRWTGETGAVESLTGFGDEAYDWYAAAASSDDSVIVGYRWPAGVEPGDRRGIAFRWEAGEVEMLGELPGGAIQSRAADISGDGRIIVGHSESEAGRTAFVWDATQGMRSLQQVLQQRGVNVSGWNLSTAVAISQDGTQIAGTGTNPQGEPQSFLATLPRPKTSP